MEIIAVSVPGPWWTRLSYLHDTILEPGVRVLVPLGRGVRVGIVVTADGTEAPSVKLKPILEVLDSRPPLPADIAKTLNWFAETWFVGMGLAAKTLLPSKFLEKESLTTLTEKNVSHGGSSVSYIYETCDSRRFERYLDLARSFSGGALFLFPEVSAAKRFWRLLPEESKSDGALWPVTNPLKQWKLWQEAREGSLKLIVGSQAAAFAPMKGLSLIVVDDENSRGWRTQKHPYFHYRSLLAARAKFAGAELLLGGRMPSSKAYMQCGSENTFDKSVQKRLIFVDLHDSSSFDVDAVKDSVMISRPLIRETKDCLKKGEWAFWLLDRKGYAGEIYCNDCGLPVRCPKCGGVMRWEGRENRMSCLSCSCIMPVPGQCPSCGGPFLEGIRPGLEALSSKARHLLGCAPSDILLFQNDGDKIPPCKTLLKEHPQGGLILGTRKILAMTDELSPSMIGWIDSDSEARQTEYDAKVRAFALIWESIWRGGNSEQRKVVIQSRRPGRGWQMGLSCGWGIFWKNEIRERRDWELPPFMPMLKITMPAGMSKTLTARLEEECITFWESEESADEIWVRTKKFSTLYKILAPFFHIKNVRNGFPTVLLFLD